MAVTRSRAARGLVVLALAGAVAATSLAGSVTAAPKPATKKFVNKQIKKLSSNVIHQPVYYQRSDAVTIPAAAYEEAFVACPPGTSVLGGGIAPQVFPGPPQEYFDVEVEASHPSTGTDLNAGTTGWSVGIEGAPGVVFRAYAICAAVQKVSNYTDGTPAARMAGGGSRA